MCSTRLGLFSASAKDDLPLPKRALCPLGLESICQSAILLPTWVTVLTNEINVYCDPICLLHDMVAMIVRAFTFLDDVTNLYISLIQQMSLPVSSDCKLLMECNSVSDWLAMCSVILSQLLSKYFFPGRASFIKCSYD